MLRDLVAGWKCVHFPVCTGPSNLGHGCGSKLVAAVISPALSTYVGPYSVGLSDLRQRWAKDFRQWFDGGRGTDPLRCEVQSVSALSVRNFCGVRQLREGW